MSEKYSSPSQIKLSIKMYSFSASVVRHFCAHHARYLGWLRVSSAWTSVLQRLSVWESLFGETSDKSLWEGILHGAVSQIFSQTGTVWESHCLLLISRAGAAPTGQAQPLSLKKAAHLQRLLLPQPMQRFLSCLFVVGGLRLASFFPIANPVAQPSRCLPRFIPSKGISRAVEATTSHVFQHLDLWATRCLRQSSSLKTSHCCL